MAGKERLFTTQGLILKSKPFGERDRLISLLSPGRGKLTCVAPGARKTKSSLAALVEPFTYGNYLMHQGRNLYTIRQADIITFFSRLRNDLESYTFASHICQLVDDVVEDDGGQIRELFKLLYRSLLFMEKGAAPALIGLAFHFKLLKLLGYAPHLAGCLHCGREASIYYLHVEEGGIVCFNCLKSADSSSYLSQGSLALSRLLLKGNWAAINNLKLNEEQYKELSFFSRVFLQRWLGVENFKAFNFLEKLNRT